jgi:hypothetical protein
MSVVEAVYQQESKTVEASSLRSASGHETYRYRLPGQSNCLLWTLFLPKTSLLSFVGIALVCFAIPWFYIMLMQERAVNTFKALCSLAAMRICNVIFPKHLQLKRL